MMKRVVYLSMAAYAGAASLRGEGVEEVGEQIENFPAEGYDGYTVQRRILHVDEDGNEMEEMAGRIMEEYFEDGDFAEEAYVEDPDVDIMGNEVEDELEDVEYYWDEEDAPAGEKEHAPDADSITVEGNSLLGDGEEVVVYDLHERRDATCGDNKGEVKLIMKTDFYAYETNWKLIDNNGNKVVAQGPPANTNYADSRMYSGRWCLPPGRYRVVINDKGNDGMCTGNPSQMGCGYVKVFLNGANSGQIVGDKSRWNQKNIQVNVTPISSRIDGVDNGNNNGGWCNKVRSVMKVPQGTCTLPNGQRGHRVRVTTKVDKYGKETSWKVRKNGVVKMQMGAIIAANDQKAIEDCLPAGDYQFVMDDLDGLCCRHGQGFFKIAVNGQTLISGGSFTKSITHNFRLGFDWIGSMGERDCEWWWSHDYRRRDWHTRCYDGQFCNKSYRHLKWSPDLKAAAADYAQRLLATCDTNGIKHDATEQGENLAKNKGTGTWGDLYTADKVTKRFVDNEEFWGWNGNAHLTQAMWYPTRYMGCAESVKNMGGNKMCRMQVCRFAKAGNCMMGKYNSAVGKNWMTPMMMDDSPCGPMCPPGQGGCYA